MEQNFETPEELLEAIGFGGLEKKRTISDGLGFNYKMPPYELVQVSRPASKYTDFNLWDREAGIPK